MPAPDFLRVLPVTVTLMGRVDGEPDEYGDSEVEYTSLGTAQAFMQQSLVGTDESDGGATQNAAFRFWLEPTPLTGWDAIIYEDEHYALMQDPSPVLNARTGELHHLEVEAKRTR